MAIEECDADIVRLLLDAQVDVNAEHGSGKPLLVTAGEAGRSYIAELVLAKGADVNQADAMGNRPLHIAARKGDLEMVRTLLGQSGAQTSLSNLNDETAEEIAARLHHRDIVQALQDHDKLNSRSNCLVM